MIVNSQARGDSADQASRRPQISNLFPVGICVYLISFMLPAVNIQGKLWEGFAVAFFALDPWSSLVDSPLAFFGGVINPLLAALVYLRLSNHAKHVGTFLAVVILFCIPMTWLALDQMHYEIKVGFFAWIVGILLIILTTIRVVPGIPGAK